MNIKQIKDKFFKLGKSVSFPCNGLQQRMQNCELTKKEKIPYISLKRKKL